MPAKLPEKATFETLEIIAKYIGCESEILKHSCRVWQDIPSASSPEYIDKLKSAAKARENGARFARGLATSLRDFSHLTGTNLMLPPGCEGVTVEQIDLLEKALEDDCRYYLQWSRGYDRTGGRNPAAYVVAHLIRQVYFRLGKRITLGNNDGLPSTDFGRAVEFALSEFKISSDWRRPAEDARKKFLQMEQEYLARQAETPEGEAVFPWIGIHIGEMGGELYFTAHIFGRPDIPELWMPEVNFPSISEARRVSENWAVQCIAEGNDTKSD